MSAASSSPESLVKIFHWSERTKNRLTAKPKLEINQMPHVLNEQIDHESHWRRSDMIIEIASGWLLIIKSTNNEGGTTLKAYQGNFKLLVGDASQWGDGTLFVAAKKLDNDQGLSTTKSGELTLNNRSIILFQSSSSTPILVISTSNTFKIPSMPASEMEITAISFNGEDDIEIKNSHQAIIVTKTKARDLHGAILRNIESGGTPFTLGGKYPLINCSANRYSYDILNINPLDIEEVRGAPSSQLGIKKEIFEDIEVGDFDWAQVSGADFYIKSHFNYAGIHAGAGSGQSKVVYGYSQLKKFVSNKVELSLGYEAELNGLTYGASYENEEVFSEEIEETNKHESVYSIDRRIHQVYRIIHDTTKADLTYAFVADIISVKNATDAVSFVEKWGTHYPESVIYGGLFFATLQESLAEYHESKHTATEFQQAVSSTAFYQAGGAVTQGEGQSTTTTIKGKSKNVKYFFIGGSASGADTWSADISNSNPIELSLKPIYELFKFNEYINKDKFKDLSITTTQLETSKTLVTAAIISYLGGKNYPAAVVPFYLEISLVSITIENGDKMRLNKDGTFDLGYYGFNIHNVRKNHNLGREYKTLNDLFPTLADKQAPGRFTVKNLKKETYDASNSANWTFFPPSFDLTDVYLSLIFALSVSKIHGLTSHSQTGTNFDKNSTVFSDSHKIQVSELNNGDNILDLKAVFSLGYTITYRVNVNKTSFQNSLDTIS